ncbi:carbamoyltransferase C-terminal domain-containing protein [Bacillus tequilensis]|uniref:Carbamoyltransferase n=1 Tax=Bacillus tequilensis TaxID=227866 RepID=A0A6H0WMP0_9BACI|nr:carbamoyltransferase C-terminal domain-containing protein [Bacillus tequilensis]QIW79955.1 hypothetical protein G4P54_09130 [Bacillus tequilensis]
MITVGLNACIVNDDDEIRYVDGGGVCIFKDNHIAAAITEERLSYIKYDGGFKKSLPYVLESCNLSLEDVDQFVVSFYGVSINVPQFLIDHIKKEIGINEKQSLIVIPTHHLSHAYAAYFSSGYDSALIIINDNEGQIIGEKTSPYMFENTCERNSYYIGNKDKIKLVDRDFDYPYALGFGKLYNKITTYLGLGNYHNAGKTMGLSSYGSGAFENIGDAYRMDYDGNLHCIIEDTGDTEKDIKNLFSKLSVTIPDSRKRNEPLKQIHADMAEYIQKQLEKWTRVRAEFLLNKYNLSNICVGGGVALNCLSNSQLLDIKRVESVYVPSAPQDQGLCIGNALYGVIEDMKERNIPVSPNFNIPLYLGKEYRIKQEDLRIINKKYKGLTFKEMDNITTVGAKLLSEGKVIGWYQGKSEFGPRALGNRSILADPRDKLVMNRLNLEIKKREAFRPFAPSVILEKTSEYFINFRERSPSMMFTATVNPDKRNLLSAITHIDGTARLQTVQECDNELYYKLIKKFGEITGVYVVLDTSFNLNGMPIVETPEDAISCFAESNLDALILDNYLIWRI